MLDPWRYARPTVAKCTGMNLKGEPCPYPAKGEWQGRLMCGKHLKPHRENAAKVMKELTQHHDGWKQWYARELRHMEVATLEWIISSAGDPVALVTGVSFDQARRQARVDAAREEIARRGGEQ